MTSFRHALMSVMLLLWAGCGQTAAPPAPATSYDSYGGYGYGTQEITFLSDAPMNAATDVGLSDMQFTNLEGAVTKVRELAAANGAVVVVTRGNTNPICPYCSTQTADYIRDYDQFRQRGVEVVLIYPIETRDDTSRLTAFLDDARSRVDDPQKPVPFPVLFDVELTAVDQLGIRKDLSKPATYLVDPVGNVTYAYVGSHWGDRPAVSAVLKELEQRRYGGAASQADATAANDPPAAVEPTVPTAPAQPDAD